MPGTARSHVRYNGARALVAFALVGAACAPNATTARSADDLLRAQTDAEHGAHARASTTGTKSNDAESSPPLDAFTSGAPNWETGSNAGAESRDDADHVRADTVPGWLGINMRQTEDGVVVANVLRGSPAAAAGLQPGDRLLRIGSQLVAVTSDVTTFVQEQKPGTRVNLDVRRGKETRLLHATLVAKPEREAAMRADLVGREAPSISTLQTVQGSVIPSWNRLKGQVVVLYFWASWCVACRALSPTLNEWQQELAPTGVTILGITMDPYEEASRASRALKFPTYTDESGDISVSYQGTALPTLIVVDKSSIVREVMAGLNFERVDEIKRLVRQLSREPEAHE